MEQALKSCRNGAFGSYFLYLVLDESFDHEFCKRINA
jgi:hypothetical protein